VSSGDNLEIPRWYKVPRKALLKSPRREFAANWDYVSDVLRNIIGFIPLGLIVCAYFKCTLSQSRAIVSTILVGAMLSFTIELLQFYVPPRNSGITDIITNTLGTAVGAMLLRPSLFHALRKSWLITFPPRRPESSQSS